MRVYQHLQCGRLPDFIKFRLRMKHAITGNELLVDENRYRDVHSVTAESEPHPLKKQERDKRQQIE